MSVTVLVVDDQPSLRQMVRFALQFQGMRVVEAEDGIEALAKLNSLPVNMLITDWKMPKMDGLELVRKVRSMEQFANLPILMISCEAGLFARHEVQAEEGLAWLKKPFRMKELQSVVQMALETSPSVRVSAS